MPMITRQNKVLKIIRPKLFKIITMFYKESLELYYTLMHALLVTHTHTHR